MKRLVLIDGNNWGFAGNGKVPIYSGTRKVQAIHYVLNRVRETYEQYPNAMIMVLWDGRSWRKDIYAEYKGKREVTEKQREMKAAYMAQKPDIIKGLKLLGVTQSIAANMEADDLAYTLTQNAASKGIPVTLLTADEDWQQLVQPGVNWIDIIRDKTCDYQTFKRDTGFNDPIQFVEAKTILGDTGDNIIGPKGIGPAKLQTIYAWWPNFCEFLEELKNNPQGTAEFWQKIDGKKLPKVFRELDIPATVEILKQNDRLANLATDARPAIVDLKNTRKPLIVDDFREFASSVSLQLRGKALDDFLGPFLNNKNTITGNGQ